MRRGVGAGYILQKEDEQIKYEKVGNIIHEIKLTEATKEFELFAKKLQEFALKHRKRINDDAYFRQKFHEMCNYLGVDPLISNKNLWSKYLGIGNFYAELGVQILTICMITRNENAGILDINECIQRINNMRRLKNSSFVVSTDEKKNNHGGKNTEEEKKQKKFIAEEITANDIERAISKLSILGEGSISLLKSAEILKDVNNNKKVIAKNKCLIISMIDELNSDQIICLKVAQEKGFLTYKELQIKFNWSIFRCENVMNFFLSEGIAWLDEQYIEDGNIGIAFWFISMAL